MFFLLVGVGGVGVVAVAVAIAAVAAVAAATAAAAAALAQWKPSVALLPPPPESCCPPHLAWRGSASWPSPTLPPPRRLPRDCGEDMKLKHCRTILCGEDVKLKHCRTILLESGL